MLFSDIFVGDCREQLKRFAASSIQCCVTSPPYFGLRDYQTGTREGGSLACDHVVGEIRTGKGMVALGARYAGGGKKAAEFKPLFARDVCPKCGAQRFDKQIGGESSLNAYVAELVSVFSCVKRALCDEGTLWLNLGDTYADKNLLMVPARVALALQDDGWYLRSDIIWHKPNPMPSSATDRPVSAYEHVFLFAKSDRYLYNHALMREPAVKGASGSTFTKGKTGVTQGDRVSQKPREEDGMRNMRNVWTISTKPFKGAHFATFPLDLAERCVLGGSRSGDFVLDPFAGAGTVGVACKTHQRHFAGIELNPAYADMARQRIAAHFVG